LAERRIHAIDAASLIATRQRSRPAEQLEDMLSVFLRHAHPIVCIEGLFDLAAAGSGWAALLVRHFEVVDVPGPTAAENAITLHQFDEARRHSDEERQERENLERMREARAPAEPAKKTITAADIEEAVARRIGAPVAAVRRMLQEKEAGEFNQILAQLAAYLRRCSTRKGWSAPSGR
jgi:hypothetical protein